MAKPTIITRATKGSALTWTEGDTNLENLRDATITVSDGTNSKAIDLNGTIQFASGTNATVSVNSSTGVVTVSATGGGDPTFQADNSTNATNYLLFGSSQTANEKPRTDSLLTYNPASSSLTIGDASAGEVNAARFNGLPVTGGNPAQIYAPGGTNKDIWIYGGYDTVDGYLRLGTAGHRWPNTNGSANQVLKTDGSGNLSWTTITSFNPAAPGPIGNTTPSTGNFTGISAGNNNLLISTSGGISMGGTGTTLTMSPATTGNINNTNIGATTPATGKFTTLESTGRTTLKDIKETVFSLTYAATITPDVANGTIQTVTLTGNVTFSAFANPVAGQSLTLIIKQDATGSRTLTSTMKFSGGTKTLSTAANSVDIISVFYDGTNYYASLGKGFA